MNSFKTSNETNHVLCNKQSTFRKTVMVWCMYVQAFRRKQSRPFIILQTVSNVLKLKWKDLAFSNYYRLILFSPSTLLCCRSELEPINCSQSLGPSVLSVYMYYLHQVLPLKMASFLTHKSVLLII